MNLKPVVYNPTADPPFQLLQQTDNLAIPSIESRMAAQEEKTRALSRILLEAGFDLEEILTEDL